MSQWKNNPFETLVVPIITAVSQTARAAYMHALGYAYEIISITSYCVTEAGTVTVNPQKVDASYDGILVASGLAIDAVPEKFKTGAFTGFLDGLFFAKAAETAQVFSAAHVITANKYGIILIQNTAAGVESTKVPAATPTTAMAYNTAAEALAALPSPDANNVSVGYILIANNAVDWTANTDDMTDGSDVTTATFTSATISAGSVDTILSSALGFTSGTQVAGALATDRLTRIFSATDVLNIPYTSDGTGALTNGFLSIKIRKLDQ